MKRGVRQIVTIIYVSHMCKRILDSNINEAVIDKISNLHKIAIFKYNWNFLDKLLQPYKFLWQGHVVSR